LPTLRIAYLINQYPKVSHSFIRREILALERQGFEVMRLAVRGWNEPLVDAEDVAERAQTRYVLQAGVAPLLWGALRALFANPLRFAAALALAVRMRAGADRRLLYHLAYLAEACRILPWVQSFGALHVHAHFATNATEVAMLLHALGGPPYSFTVHGTAEFDRLDVLGIAEKVRRAAFVVSVSSYGRSQLYRRIDHASWSKVNVVRCGLEAKFYGGPAAPLPAEPRIVCVGRLSAEKGQLLLIEAVRRLVRKGMRLQLMLAGDGELRAELEQLIRRYGLERHVRIGGWVSSSQVREEILASRGLVLPSFSEGLPVVVMEAMALGRPVLCTFVGGIPELVRHGEDGWLFPAGSVGALARALEDLLAAPAAELERMGKAARAHAVELHSVDVEAAKLAALFRQSSGDLSPAASAPRSTANGARL
jgi:colanic acid/amylovoran biosynthesis glycosyltransferase